MTEAEVDLSAFWKLADLNEQVRTKACTDLINKLKSEFVGKDLVDLTPTLEYTITRLIKGLASSRGAARQGFSLALTEILRTFAGASTEYILSLGAKFLTPSNKANGQEQKDAQMGYIFLAFVLARAGRVADCSLQGPALLGLVQKLVKSAQSKAALKEATFQCIIEVLLQIPDEVLWSRGEFSVLPAFIAPFKGKDTVQALSPEELSLALALKHKASSQNSNLAGGEAAVEKKGKGKKKGGNLDYNQYLPNVVKTLLAPNTDFTTYLPVLTASLDSFPRVHSVWKRVTTELARVPTEDGTSLLTKFWNTIVEGEVFGKESHHTQRRKYWGFQLLATILKDEAVPSTNLLTPLLLRSLFNCLCNKKSALHQCAKQTFAVVVSTHNTSQSALALLTHLVKQGHGNWASRAGAVGLSSLLNHLHSDALEQYLAFLTKTVNKLLKHRGTDNQHDLHSNASSTKEGEEEEPGKKGQGKGKDKGKGKGGKGGKKKDEEGEGEGEGEGEEGEDKGEGSGFVWIADHVFSVGKAARKLPQGKAAWEGALKFLMTTAYFAAADPATIPQVQITESVAFKGRAVTKEFRAAATQRLSSLLQYAVKLDNNRAPKASAEKGKKGKEKGKEKEEGEGGSGWSEDASVAPQLLIDFWQHLTDNGFVVRGGVSEEAAAGRANALRLAHKLKKKATKELSNGKAGEGDAAAAAAAAVRSKQFLALHLLFTHLALLCLTEPTEAPQLIQELEMCYEKLYKSPEELAAEREKEKEKAQAQAKAKADKAKAKKPNGKGKAADGEGAEADEGDEGEDEEEEEEEEASALQVLVDLLISLLARSSSLFRELATHVFDAFAVDMNVAPLDDLLQLLKQKRSKRKGAEDDEGLLDVERGPSSGLGEGADEGDDDEDDDQLISMEELTSGALPGLTDDEDEEEEEDEGDEGDKPSSKRQKKNEKKKASGKSQDEAIEQRVVEAIRKNQQRRADRKEVQREEVNFKSRVLDLVEAVITRQAGEPLLLHLFLGLQDVALALRPDPSVNAALRGLQQALYNRLLNVYQNKLCKPHKPLKLEAPLADALRMGIQRIFTQLIARAKAGSHKELLPSIAQALAALTKILLSEAGKNGEESQKFVLGEYKALLTGYLGVRRSLLHTKFFLDMAALLPVTTSASTPTPPPPTATPSKKGGKDKGKKDAAEEQAVVVPGKGLGSRMAGELLVHTIELGARAPTEFLTTESFRIAAALFAAKPALDESTLTKVVRDIRDLVAKAFTEAKKSSSIPASDKSKEEKKKEKKGKEEKGTSSANAVREMIRVLSTACLFLNKSTASNKGSELVSALKDSLQNPPSSFHTLRQPINNLLRIIGLPVVQAKETKDKKRKDGGAEAKGTDKHLNKKAKKPTPSEESDGEGDSADEDGGDDDDDDDAADDNDAVDGDSGAQSDAESGAEDGEGSSKAEQKKKKKVRRKGRAGAGRKTSQKTDKSAAGDATTGKVEKKNKKENKSADQNGAGKATKENKKPSKAQDKSQKESKKNKQKPAASA